MVFMMNEFEQYDELIEKARRCKKYLQRRLTPEQRRAYEAEGAEYLKQAAALKASWKKESVK